MSEATTYPHVSLMKYRGRMSGFSTVDVDKGEVYLVNDRQEATLVSDPGHGNTYTEAMNKALWWAKFLKWPVVVSEKKAVTTYETKLLQVIAYSDNMEV